MTFSLVTLRVSNLENSLAFYQKILRQSIIAQFSNAAGERIVMLGREDLPHLELVEMPVQSRPLGAGVSIGFQVEDAEKIIKQVQLLYPCKPIGPISPNEHIRFTFINDPDGYQIQLLEEL